MSERTNWQFIRWMTGLALQHPKKCLWLLVLNISLLVLTLSGLSLIGMAFDVIRHEVDRSAPKPEGIFGISPPEHVAAVGRYGDAAVVGSALVALIAEASSSPDLIVRVEEYVRSLRAACVPQQA